MILVTGGCGFIGSHTVVQLLERGEEVVILDNLSNSKRTCIERIEKITGKKPIFIQADITNSEDLDKIFSSFPIRTVMHFAGLKAVGDSINDPDKYEFINVTGSKRLFESMHKNNVFNVVFSSSATVYGINAPIPYTEKTPRGIPGNPYARSKCEIEKILEDYCLKYPKWSAINLRYFNPIGAHPSGLIGEDPLGPPNNLIPFITQVAVGRRSFLSIFGNDYATKDGTCERDFIHVDDVAAGHIAALDELELPGCKSFNLGTGKATSVLEIVHQFEKVTGKKIPYKIVDRRNGDIAKFWADPVLAKVKLGWTATKTLDKMLKDAWNWQSNNPLGFNDKN